LEKKVSFNFLAKLWAVLLAISLAFSSVYAGEVDRCPFDNIGEKYTATNIWG